MATVKLSIRGQCELVKRSETRIERLTKHPIVTTFIHHSFTNDSYQRSNEW